MEGDNRLQPALKPSSLSSSRTWSCRQLWAVQGAKGWRRTNLVIDCFHSCLTMDMMKDHDDLVHHHRHPHHNHNHSSSSSNSSNSSSKASQHTQGLLCAHPRMQFSPDSSLVSTTTSCASISSKNIACPKKSRQAITHARQMHHHQTGTRFESLPISSLPVRLRGIAHRKSSNTARRP